MTENQEHIVNLVRACRSGDQEAQFEVYKLYYKAMFNTALRILGDSFEAEDIMQEAFLKAFSKLETFKEEAAFGAWLKRIVINLSLTQVKKKNKNEEVKLEVVEYKLEDEGSQGMSQEDYSSLKVKEVMASMEKLKENYKIILNLSLIEGYDNEEIAEILNISNENCRTTISRAKSKLRSLLLESSTIN